MKRIQFFADDIDIGRLMDFVEQIASIYYAPTLSAKEEAKIVSTYKELDYSLGYADAQSTMACRAYLLALSPQAIQPRVVQTNEGKNYLYDQLICEDTVVFRPAGKYGDNVILMGEVSTRVETTVSKEIMKAFSKAFKKTGFVKYEGFLVGASAFRHLIEGGRLTLALETPFCLPAPN